MDSRGSGTIFLPTVAFRQKMLNQDHGLIGTLKRRRRKVLAQWVISRRFLHISIASVGNSP
jgi:hypothetical protein